MKSAVLIHTIGWDSDLTNVELKKGVNICKTVGSDVEKLYHYLCSAENVDQGEAFDYESHIIVDESAHDELFPYWQGPHSIISRICNIIAIFLSYPPGMCRIIITKDDFKTSRISEIIYDHNDNLDFLRAEPDQIKIVNKGEIHVNESCKSLTNESLDKIKRGFDNQLAIESKNKKWFRLENALCYFFNSWRSYQMEHVCLNLAIAIESLFSPASNTELSHRIAFNMSRFYGTNRKERESVYDLIRNFYNLRSKIAHGDEAKDEDLYTITPRVFNIVSKVLQRILLNEETIETFCDKNKLASLFRDWAFE
jgi:hypothetical protein